MTRNLSPRTRSARRGASAVEFALVVPIIVTMLLGAIDYGFMFSQESQAMSALTGSLRAASDQLPGIDSGPGQCPDCLDVAGKHAVSSLQNIGVTMASGDMSFEIIDVQGTCAITLVADVPYEPIVGLVPMPSSYRIETAWMLLNVKGC